MRGVQLFLEKEKHGSDGGNHVQNAAHNSAEHEEADCKKRAAEQLAEDQMALLFLLIRENVAGHGENSDGLPDDLNGRHKEFLS